jgi:hypothetical protein
MRENSNSKFRNSGRVQYWLALTQVWETPLFSPNPKSKIQNPKSKMASTDFEFGITG